MDVVEICVAKELQVKLDPSTSEATKNPCKESVQILNEQETLSTAKLKAHRLACGYLVKVAHYIYNHLYKPFVPHFKLVPLIPAFGI